MIVSPRRFDIIATGKINQVRYFGYLWREIIFPWDWHMEKKSGFLVSNLCIDLFVSNGKQFFHACFWPSPMPLYFFNKKQIAVTRVIVNGVIVVIREEGFLDYNYLTVQMW